MVEGCFHSKSSDPVQAYTSTHRSFQYQLRVFAALLPPPTHTHKYTHAHTLTRTLSYTQIHARTHKHTLTHTLILTITHINTRTHAHTHRHTHTRDQCPRILQSVLDNRNVQESRLEWAVKTSHCTGLQGRLSPFVRHCPQ